jgi:hypothetical protein
MRRSALLLLPALLALAACTQSQRITIDQPPGHRASAVAHYLEACDRPIHTPRDLLSLLYPEKITKEFHASTSAPGTLVVPYEVRHGTCIRMLRGLTLFSTPPGVDRPLDVFGFSINPEHPEPQATEFSVECHRRPIPRPFNAMEELYNCHRPGSNERNWHSIPIVSTPELRPFHVRVDLHAHAPSEVYETPYSWVTIDGNSYPYTTARDGQRPRVALRDFRLGSRTCHSYPACDYAVEPSVVLERAHLHNRLSLLFLLRIGSEKMPTPQPLFPEWISRQVEVISRWDWNRTEQQLLALRGSIHPELAGDPAWEPLPGESPEAHYQRCLERFDPLLPPPRLDHCGTCS